MAQPKEKREILLQTLLQYRAGRILTPLESFICKQAAAGILLITMTVLAMIIANSQWEYLIQTASNIEFGFILNQMAFELTIGDWISEGLLAIFFFLVGLEIKQEMLIGRLSHPKQAMLVITAAIGGMIVPALLYWLLNHGEEGAHGWAIPMTTDTAFAMGVLALMARRVSVSASVFLMALAIIDDVLTIAIITLFYTSDFDMAMLLKACIPLGLLFACNALGFRRGWIYIILGAFLWFYIHEAGLHATLAGLLLAFAVPAKPIIGHRRFMHKLKGLIFDYEKGEQPDNKTILSSHAQHHLTSSMGEAIKSASTPLQNWHTLIATPIAIFVLPLFALFNAGIYLTQDNLLQAMHSSISLGIILGLVVGKPLGIVLFSFLIVRAKLSQLPDDMPFSELAGVGMLSGIGFTMSLFIVLLGFEGNEALIEQAKIGILIASVIAALAGSLWLFWMERKSVV